MKKAASKSACGLSANYTALSQRMELFITTATRTSNLSEGNRVSQTWKTTDGIKVLALQLTRWVLEIQNNLR
jgi:hypothetical protein